MHMDRERGRSVPTFIEIQPGTRRRIEQTIERLISMLDFIDGDPDLEPDNDDEPSLGSLGGTAAHRGCAQSSWSGGGDNDREFDPVDQAKPYFVRLPKEPRI